MTRRTRARRAVSTPSDPGAGDGMSPRQPCPCGSGRRYKNCHGAGDVAVSRPFEGLPRECDWIALRELVPSATAPLRLAGDEADRDVTLATVLPLALPAIVRPDGRILLGLQVHARSGDVGRDLAYALEQALQAEPGSMLSGGGRPGPGRRLQDLLDLSEPLDATLHGDFGFWLEAQTGQQYSAEVQASMERANAAIVPTERIAGLGAAYWCQIGDKAHVRWVMPQDEDELLDGFARLAVRKELGLGSTARYAGSFRAHGRLVPVWDVPGESTAAEWAEPAAAFGARLADALAEPGPLPDPARRARDGLRGRQLTLR